MASIVLWVLWMGMVLSLLCKSELASKTTEPGDGCVTCTAGGMQGRALW